MNMKTFSERKDHKFGKDWRRMHEKLWKEEGGGEILYF